MYSGYKQLVAMCPATELLVVINQWWHYGRLQVSVSPFAKREERGVQVALWEGVLQRPLKERPESNIERLVLDLLTEAEFEPRKFFATGEVSGNCMLCIEIESATILDLCIHQIKGDYKIFSRLRIELNCADSEEQDWLSLGGMVWPADECTMQLPWNIVSKAPTGHVLPRQIKLEQ